MLQGTSHCAERNNETCPQCVDAVGWAAGRASGPLKKLQWWGAGMVICLKQGANDLHMVQLMSLPPHHLCFRKIQNGLSLWYMPTRVVLDKRLLNKYCVVLLLKQWLQMSNIPFWLLDTGEIDIFYATCLVHHISSCPAMQSIFTTTIYCFAHWKISITSNLHKAKNVRQTESSLKHSDMELTETTRCLPD